MTYQIKDLPNEHASPQDGDFLAIYNTATERTEKLDVANLPGGAAGAMTIGSLWTTAQNSSAIEASRLHRFSVVSGNISQSLPSPAGFDVGTVIGFKVTVGNGNSLTLNAAASTTVDGASSVALRIDGETLWMVADGSTWRVVYASGNQQIDSFTITGPGNAGLILNADPDNNSSPGGGPYIEFLHQGGGQQGDAIIGTRNGSSFPKDADGWYAGLGGDQFVIAAEGGVNLAGPGGAFLRLSSTGIAALVSGLDIGGQFAEPFGTIYATNGTIQTSDERLKEDIDDTPLGLDFILRLRPVQFRWKDGKDTGLHHGLIAQQVLGELGETEFAGLTKDGETYGLNYSELIGPLIRAVQELQAQIEQLGA